MRIVDKVVVYESVEPNFLGLVDFDILALREDHRGGRFDIVGQWCEEQGKKVVRLKSTEGDLFFEYKKDT